MHDLPTIAIEILGNPLFIKPIVKRLIFLYEYLWSLRSKSWRNLSRSYAKYLSYYRNCRAYKVYTRVNKISLNEYITFEILIHFSVREFNRMIKEIVYLHRCIIIGKSIYTYIRTRINQKVIKFSGISPQRWSIK